MLAQLLGLERRSALDNPRFNLSDPGAWEYLFGQQTGTESGIPMNASKALEYNPVWQAVNLISGDIAKLPLNVYRRNADDTREVDINHPVQRLIRRRANSQMAAYKFWRRMLVHVLIWNNAYALINRRGGTPIELLPLLPDRTMPKDDGGGGTYYVSEINGQKKPYSSSDILHIEGITIEGMGECQLVTKARDSWALGLAAEKFASKFFRRGGRIGGILELPQAMTKQSRDRLEEGFRKQYEQPDAAFSTVVLRENAKFHAAQMSPEQTQMREAMDGNRLAVASWFNLPPHKLGDASRTSYNSLEQENRAYIDSCLSHWMRAIEAECWMKLLSQDEQESLSPYVEYNTDAFIAADIRTQTEVGRMEIEMGTLSPNEFRRMKNRPPREGGDVYLTPMNMDKAGPDAEDPEDEPADEPADEPQTPPEVDPPEPDQTAGRMERLLDICDEAIDRGVRSVTAKVIREVKRKKPDRFLVWVDDKYSSCSEDFSSAVLSAIRAIESEEPQEVIDLISREFIDGLHSDLEQALETATEEADLLELVLDICHRHSQHAANEIGQKLREVISCDV